MIQKKVLSLRHSIDRIMKIRKVSALLLLLGALSFIPSYAQKFSKKEQEKRAAREANYFYGSSFTLTAGYLHSWMTDGLVDPLSMAEFGHSEYFKNTHDAFNIGFLWDHSFSKHWGMQHGLYYTQKGGEKISYHDAGFGVGPIPVSMQEISIGGIELQSMGRFFIPLTRESRLSIQGGFYLTKMLNESASGVRKWDMGLMCGLGYDWRHLAVSVNYQPGIYSKVCDNSETRINALMLNVGFRFWKK